MPDENKAETSVQDQPSADPVVEPVTRSSVDLTQDAPAVHTGGNGISEAEHNIMRNMANDAPENYNAHRLMRETLANGGGQQEFSRALFDLDKKYADPLKTQQAMLDGDTTVVVDREEKDKKKYPFSMMRGLRALDPEAGKEWRNDGAADREILEFARSQAQAKDFWGIPRLARGYIVPTDELLPHPEHHLDNVKRTEHWERAVAEIQEAADNNQALWTGRRVQYGLYEEGLYAQAPLLQRVHNITGQKGSQDIIQLEKGTNAAATRKGESTAMDESTIETESVLVTPTQLSTSALISTDTYELARPDFEALQLVAVQKAFGIKIVQDMLHGRGTAPTPKGLSTYTASELANKRSSGTANQGQDLTRALVLGCESDILSANAAMPNSPGFVVVVGHAMWTKGKQVGIDSPGSGLFLFSGGMTEGYPIVYDNNVSNAGTNGTATGLTYLFMGDFQKISRCTWAGLQVIPDVSKVIDDNQYRFAYYSYETHVVRQPKSFSVVEHLNRT